MSVRRCPSLSFKPPGAAQAPEGSVRTRSKAFDNVVRGNEMGSGVYGSEHCDRDLVTFMTCSLAFDWRCVSHLLRLAAVSRRTDLVVRSIYNANCSVTGSAVFKPCNRSHILPCHLDRRSPVPDQSGSTLPPRDILPFFPPGLEYPLPPFPDISTASSKSPIHPPISPSTNSSHSPLQLCRSLR